MSTFCVVGAGIIGLSSALCIAKRRYGCKITIVYDECSPETTSNHGFGLCGALHLDDTDDCDKYLKWAKATSVHLSQLFREYKEKSPDTGIREIDYYFVRDKDDDGKDAHLWEIFQYSRPATKCEIEALGIKAEKLEYVLDKKGLGEDDVAVHKAGSFIIDTDIYLPWLLGELKKMENKKEISELRLIKRKIHSFSEVFEDGDDYDCIVNCSGLGSKYLVPDHNVIPIRGQYLLMESEGISDVVRADCNREVFVCALPGRLKVGATHQKGRSDRAIDPNDTREILRRCECLYPKMCDCRIIKEDVGIRPGRLGGPRVDIEYRKPQLVNGKLIPLVHNYGHGTKGIVQHWGCGIEVANLVEEALMKRSKL